MNNKLLKIIFIGYQTEIKTGAIKNTWKIGRFNSFFAKNNMTICAGGFLLVLVGFGLEVFTQ